MYANLDSIDSVEETIRNQMYLESQGLHPLPVFHYGEDMKYLDELVKSYDYIALGGMVGQNANRWLEIIFNKYPTHKFHGFGMVDFRLVVKFPFFSVDSTTWFCAQKFGNILFPDGTSNHYDELNERQINIIKERGFSLQMMKDKYQCRNAFNLLVVKSVVENVIEKKVKKNEYNNIMNEII